MSKEARDVVTPNPDDQDLQQDLEFWKHYAGFGGEDKNRMVTIASWLLGLSAAMLGYIVSETISPESFSVTEPVKALLLSVVGLGVSIVAAYIAVLYGGYSNRNWEMADRIASRQKWSDLLPPPSKSRNVVD